MKTRKIHHTLTLSSPQKSFQSTYYLKLREAKKYEKHSFEQNNAMRKRRYDFKIDNLSKYI